MSPRHSSEPSPDRPAAPERSRLVLIGSMGAGKSSVARELAGQTGWRWIDTDRLVAERAGLSIAGIFSAQGEEGFRDLESEALGSLASRPELIVATGGGIVLRPRNRELLKTLGRVIWLTAREEVLFERVSRNTKRPLLHCADPRAALHELLASREPLYAACSDIRIDSSDMPHAEVAAAILEWLRERGDSSPLASPPAFPL